jgi:hypothetical protein
MFERTTFDLSIVVCKNCAPPTSRWPFRHVHVCVRMCAYLYVCVRVCMYGCVCVLCALCVRARALQTDATWRALAQLSSHVVKHEATGADVIRLA